MLRKIVLPLAAAALMAGCMMAAPYGYRDGQSGDYYYGNPSVEYRHHGVYPGYGYPGYGPYRPGLRGYGYYGYPYGYGYYGRSYYGHPYYGTPYYGTPYYRPIYRTRPTQPDTRPDGGGWRNWDELRRRRDGSTSPGGVGPSPTTVTTAVPREPRVRRSDDEGSRMGEMIRRGREGVRPSSEQDE
jgi:hypothetical protein